MLDVHIITVNGMTIYIVVNNSFHEVVLPALRFTLHDDFRGSTVVVHLTARPIKNYRALQKGDARLVIHALYYELHINMACRSFKKKYYHAQIEAHAPITQRTFHCLNSNNTPFLKKRTFLGTVPIDFNG
jgi:hypothetical protein